MTAVIARKLALLCALFCLALANFPAAAATVTATESSAVDAAGTNSEVAEKAGPAEVRFMNRHIVTFHATISGVTPEARARRATEQLERLRRAELVLPIDILDVTVNDVPMAVIRLGDRLLFLLAPGDVPPGDTHGFNALVSRVQTQLHTALNARNEFGRWPNFLRGLGYSVLATAVLGGLIKLLIEARVRLQIHLQRVIERRIDNPLSPKFDGVTSLVQLTARILRLLMGATVLVLMYGWLIVVLKQFVFTQPVGDRLSGFFISLLLSIGQSMLNAVPGLITVAVIFFITKAFRDLLGNFFDNIARGSMSFPGIHPDTLGATRRIASGVIWILGLTFAYPYIPGSQTEVFKGLSVLAGLILTLGSSGVVNQLMSGMTLIYSRSMRKGDLVRIGDVIGVVEEVNALSVKLLRLKEEITVPNAVVVSNTVRNYSRMIGGDGVIIGTTITIGYDAPWRQVHALLIAAAASTEGIANDPAPFVLQRALSDFYVEYELQIAITHALSTLEIMSRLHANIQDRFNESGVQIMSPHFVDQPAEAVVVPKENWFEKLAGKTG